jgi:hypothetical protein
MQFIMSFVLAILLVFSTGCSNSPTIPAQTVKPNTSSISSPWRWTANGIPSTELVSVTASKTPDQLSTYFQNNYIWKDDYDGVEFLSPNQVVARKSAICSGFARLWQYALEANGYTAHFIAVWAPTGAHAFCIFQYNGYWRLSSNMYYYYQPEKTMGVMGKDYMQTAAINGAIEFYGNKWQTIQIFSDSGQIIDQLDNYSVQQTPAIPGAETKTVFNIKR